jgi:hypothetical protein
LKKRTTVGLFICIIMLFVAAGCSKTNSSTTVDKTGVQTPASGDTTQSSSTTAANPGNGQNTPNLFGQVKSINGNTITLALAKMQQPQQGTTPPQNPPTAKDQSANQAPKNGGSPELTGETKTITIPDGVKITTGNKDNSKEVAITNIKAGDMLEVTLKDGAVSQVRVMQTPPQQ